MDRRAIALLALLLAACSAMPAPSDAPASIGPLPSAAPPSARATVGGITLTLEAQSGPVTAGDEIAVWATLEHDRPGDLTVFGSGSGIVFFSVTRLEDGLTSGPPVHTDDCATHILPAGGRTTIPFFKSGGFSPEDPNADFLEIYFGESELSLPAGTWRIDATTYGWLGEWCSGDTLDIATSIEVVVGE